MDMIPRLILKPTLHSLYILLVKLKMYTSQLNWFLYQVTPIFLVLIHVILYSESC